MLRTPMLGEFMGTLMMILLGDGVVAAVLLKRTKAENSGWLVITTGWCFAVMCGIFTANLFGSPDAHLNPAITLAFGYQGGQLRQAASVCSGATGGRLRGRCASVDPLRPSLADHGRQRHKAGDLLHRARHPPPVVEPDQRDHRHFRFDHRRRRHHIEARAVHGGRSRRQSLPGELPRLEHRPLARRNYRLCNQSGP